MVNLTTFLMIYTFIKLSLIINELEANEMSTLKSLWCILNLCLFFRDRRQVTRARETEFLGHGENYYNFYQRSTTKGQLQRI